MTWKVHGKRPVEASHFFCGSHIKHEAQIIFCLGSEDECIVTGVTVTVSVLRCFGGYMKMTNVLII